MLCLPHSRRRRRRRRCIISELQIRPILIQSKSFSLSFNPFGSSVSFLTNLYKHSHAHEPTHRRSKDEDQAKSKKELVCICRFSFSEICSILKFIWRSETSIFYMFVHGEAAITCIEAYYISLLYGTVRYGFCVYVYVYVVESLKSSDVERYLYNLQI